jgi:hypothetical protein
VDKLEQLWKMAEDLNVFVDFAHLAQRCPKLFGLYIATALLYFWMKPSATSAGNRNAYLRRKLDITSPVLGPTYGMYTKAIRDMANETKPLLWPRTSVKLFAGPVIILYLMSNYVVQSKKVSGHAMK